MIRRTSAGRGPIAWAAGIALAGSIACIGSVLGGSADVQASPPEPPGEPALVFAGIPWGATADSAASLLAARGYPEAPQSRTPGHLHATGRMFDHLALIEGMLDESGRVVRWEVRIRHRGEAYEYPAMRKVYDDAIEELANRHGPRRTYRESYRFPYEKGDGREDNALASGLAVIRSDWRSRVGETLRLEMSPELDVVLVYATPAAAELERRQRSHKAKDL